MQQEKFIIARTTPEHTKFTQIILEEIAASAAARGTGIARRSEEYLLRKITEGNAVIALTKKGEWAGFCYIEVWDHEKYVVNSGLIVAPAFRKHGLARKIKEAIFKLSRKKYPNAKIFGLTTGAAVMKINSALGYIPVAYSDLTKDEQFWKGCQSCVNFETLKAKNYQNCFCTAMLHTPKDVKKQEKIALRSDFEDNMPLFVRWVKVKKAILLKLKQAGKAVKFF